MNPLLAQLRKTDKKGLFSSSTSGVSYSTGFPNFDYRNGYAVSVKDENDEIIETYPQLGIGSGNVITIVGESSTGKSSWTIKAAYNIVKNFPAGFVQHYDLEGSFNKTRVINLSGMKASEFTNKYNLKSSENYMEDIIESIVEIAETKQADPDTFKYNTGKKDDLGNPIILFQPTVIIIDSLPLMRMNNDKAIQIEGLTAGGRNAIQFSEFYGKMVPLCARANIILFVINHLKDAPQLSPRDFKKPSLVFMKPGKNIPGGKTPLYLSHNVLYFDQKEKYNMAEHGFDGFMVNCIFWKSRSNKAGQSCNMVYNQQIGFDPAMTMYKYACEKELVTGRNPKKCIVGYEQLGVWDDRQGMTEQLYSKPELIKAIMGGTVPLLAQELSVVDPDQLESLNRTTAEQEGIDADAMAREEE